MKFRIQRTHLRKDGTFGVISIERDGEWWPFALTCEDPWNDNEPFASCIPAGSYRVRRIRSPHFGDTFEIVDVPGREHILFHKGNDITNTEGCVLVGEQFEPVTAKTAIAASAKGYGEFMELTKDVEAFDLDIVEV